MINSGTCDFSFSGTALALRDKGGIQNCQPMKSGALPPSWRMLLRKYWCLKPARRCGTGGQAFVIGGGVGCQQIYTRKVEALVLDEFPDVELRLPSLISLATTQSRLLNCARPRPVSQKRCGRQRPPRRWKSFYSKQIAPRRIAWARILAY